MGPPNDDVWTVSRSAPDAVRSSGSDVAAAPASTATRAPTPWAISVIRFTSGTAPVTGFASGTVTSRVWRPTRDSYCQSGSSPVSTSASAKCTVAPTKRAAVDHTRTVSSLSSRLSTTSSPSCQVRDMAAANQVNNAETLPPMTTDWAGAPTRSPIARRASSTDTAARRERSDRDPGCAGAERSVPTIARTTDSGCNALYVPSRWTMPDPSVGYKPRTRATSKLISPCYLLSPPRGQVGDGGPATLLSRARDDQTGAHDGVHRE